jgi:hypothetical protein
MMPCSFCSSGARNLQSCRASSCWYCLPALLFVTGVMMPTSTSESAIRLSTCTSPWLVRCAARSFKSSASAANFSPLVRRLCRQIQNRSSNPCIIILPYLQSILIACIRVRLQKLTPPQINSAEDRQRWSAVQGRAIMVCEFCTLLSFQPRISLQRTDEVWQACNLWLAFDCGT